MKKKHSMTSAEHFKHCVMCMYVLKDFQMCCVLDTCIFLLQEMNVHQGGQRACRQNGFKACSQCVYECLFPPLNVIFTPVSM